MDNEWYKLSLNQIKAIKDTKTRMAYEKNYYSFYRSMISHIAYHANADDYNINEDMPLNQIFDIAKNININHGKHK